MPAKGELTPKQKAFCDYYIKCGKATEAAQKAGYKQPRQQGSRLLTKDNITQYIDARMKPKEERRIASADDVLEFLTKAMKGEIQDAFGMDASLQDRINAAKELKKRYDAGKSKKDEYDIEEQRIRIEKQKAELEKLKLDIAAATGGEDKNEGIHEFLKATKPTQEDINALYVDEVTEDEETEEE